MVEGHPLTLSTERCLHHTMLYIYARDIRKGHPPEEDRTTEERNRKPATQVETRSRPQTSRVLQTFHRPSDKTPHLLTHHPLPLGLHRPLLRLSLSPLLHIHPRIHRALSLGYRNRRPELPRLGDWSFPLSHNLRSHLRSDPKIQSRHR